jgi:hypothetical protein
MANFIGIGNRIGGGSGINWSSYWLQLISATVENAASSNVVLTFPVAKTSLVASDVTCAVNGVARVVSSASWTGGVWTVVLASAVIYDDVVVMTFVKTGQTKTVTNNVLYTMLLTSIGLGTGVSTLRMTVSSDITVTLGANAKFYTDGAGTLNESATWTITSGALRTIYLKCTTGTALMTFSNVSKVTTWGSDVVDGWTSGANAARITSVIGKMPLTLLRISGTSTFTGALPTGLTYLSLNGASIAWTYNGALPTGLTSLYFDGASIAWTYNGALPTGLTYLYLFGSSIAWTYNGALPTGLTSLILSGSSIAWTYNGALPTGLTYLDLSGASIAWTYNGALPTGLTFLGLFGASMDYTGLDIGNNGNIGTFSMLNYRVAKMSSADMITLLTQMTGRAGTLPAAVTINDYADFAAPPAGVTTAVNALKLAKSITTVNLGA